MRFRREVSGRSRLNRIRRRCRGGLTRVSEVPVRGGVRFAIADGAVVEDPADAPLPERQISVAGEEIVAA